MRTRGARPKNVPDGRNQGPQPLRSATVNPALHTEEVTMNANVMRSSRFFGALVGATMAFAASASAQDKKEAEKPDVSNIPKAVMDALKEKFPKAEIHK